MDQDLLRKLPKVDEILREKRIGDLCRDVPRPVVVESIRECLGELREKILTGDCDFSYKSEDFLLITEKIIERAGQKNQNSLRRVINATGVPLHTNLGRACLSKKAYIQAKETAAHYSDLEYDLAEGRRGLRNNHIDSLIAKLTGAESAMAVNNNAAAVTLCLSALGGGREVIVSRGELVEIGGSFRIPEIMEQSGCQLVEVGTTNKTRAGDYEKAVNADTAILLKVHTSNYRILGFTEDAPLEELKKIGVKYGIPVVYDMGSGLMVDLKEYGINEPTVAAGLKAGADVILFSGDKLLGGPQSGIIAGKEVLLEKMKNHPLARMARIDKMTLAALEATFREYFDAERAKENIPVLRSITATRGELLLRARRLAVNIKKRFPKGEVGVMETENRVGGGSAPETALAGAAVTLSCPGISAKELSDGLRLGNLPIIARIERGRVLIELRAVDPDEEETLAEQAGYILEKLAVEKHLLGKRETL